MTFAEIILKNMRRRAGGYLAYFLSTAFSVVVFYLFCAMYYNPAFSVYRFGTGKMNALFQCAAAAVLLFAAIFTLYSGSFFIRGRKKEIAIYSLLGMRQRTIALLLFGETLLIGMLAALFGVAVGGVSAGRFTSALTRVMAVETSVAYEASPMAAFAALTAFAALFMVSGVRTYRTIYRYSLIDLLSAVRQREGLPRYSVAGAWIALALIAGGYAVASRMELNAPGLQLLLPAFAVAATVCAGTYLLFRNTLPMATAMLKRKKAAYYQTSTFISVSQISFRLKANPRMLALAAVLCAVAITMVSASVSLYLGLEQSTDLYAPFSYLVKDVSPEQEKRIADTVSAIGKVQITAADRMELVCAEIRNDGYAVQKGVEDAQTLGEPVRAYVLSQSAYLRIIADTQAQRGEASSLRTNFAGGLTDEMCYLLDGNMTAKYSAGLTGQPLAVAFKGQSRLYTVSGVGLHKYIGLLDLYQRPTVVVSDAVYRQYLAAADGSETDTFYGVMFDDEMASASTTAALDAFIPARFGSGGLPNNVSYIGVYKANFALYGSYVFIGLFLGVLFLLATCSVMYYKMVMEAQEEGSRYAILRKIGMSRQEMLASVAKQLGIAFGAPLVVGLAHTVFALATYNRMLELMAQETPTFQNAALVALLYVAAYGVFYLASVRSYFRIVWTQADGGAR